MDIPIITTQSYFDDDVEEAASSSSQKRRRARGSSKYEFKGSQSHRCSLVAVCEADTGKTTVKWSSVRVGREGKKPSVCTKTTSANGGLTLSSPTGGTNSQPTLGKEVKEVNRISLFLFIRTYPFTLSQTFVIFSSLVFSSSSSFFFFLPTLVNQV